ncbi:MAG TPA: chorismate synthase [Limnochordia bacterium]|nr:chorismate synthase [Limnochordia bacterium]
MASSWGEHVRITLFGESHGPQIGVVVEGLPPGEELDLGEVQAFLHRRAPGQTPWSTARRETDSFSIVSGFYQGRTTGTPLCAVLENRDARPGDYTQFARLPRPSHADYTGRVRYGGAGDPRGGGHFSGRLTAPLCAAGAICLQLLKRRGVAVFARLAQIGPVQDVPLDLARPDLEALGQLGLKDFPVVDDTRGAEMQAAIARARDQGDSLGGMVQAFVLGLPAGLGDPIFGGVESRAAAILFGIPAVKGVSFGAGFAVCARRGSENNDAFCLEEGRVRTKTNNDGGLNGGITNGMPVVVNVAIKPTPSIHLPQQTVDLEEVRETTLTATGRHDPCIVPRALPAVEAALAIAALDLLLGAHLGEKGES